MAKVNDLLIVEMSSSQLSVASTENKEYILEGIFGEIDTKNKNNRIYTEDEYVPQIQALQDKIKSSKLLGELDHPQQFDISLKSVSHIIEELYYDAESKHVKGKIRLLDTDAGRQAKALVDAGVPLQISSRAAGAVESNGKVKIKQLFTYDLVADPGFANAELKRVNESYGFDNNSGLWIYEMNGEAKSTEQDITTNINTEIKEKNMAEFVKAEDFNKYSEYLANEMKSIKESIGAKNEDNTLEDVTSHNDHIVESVNTLSEYVEYLAGKLDESIQYSEHVAEKADQGISYTENIAEKLDQGIQYSEHLAEAVGKVKDFANYVAEQANEGTKTNENLLGYVEYLKENLQQVSEYTEYIATQINENLVEEEVEDESGEPAEELEDETVKSDAEVKDETEEAEVGELPAEDEGEDGAKEVAETEETTDEMHDEEAEEVEEDKVNENPAAALAAIELAKELEDAKEESEETPEVTEEDEAGEGADEVVEDEDEEFHTEAEEVTEEEDEAEAPGAEKEEAEGGEEAGDNSKEGDVEPGDSGEPAEELEDETEDVSEVEPEGETEEAEAGESDEETEGEEGAHDPLESYKKEISSKLDTLVEAAQVKENENPAFLNVVSGSVQEAYNALNEDAKTEVRGRVTKRAFMNESQISAIIENANAVVEAKNNEPFFMTAIPAEYKEKFESLTEGKQTQIKAQANYHTLKTEYQVRNFWETRDLREVKVDLEKLAAVNESTVVEEADKPLYDVSNYAEGLKKRFKK